MSSDVFRQLMGVGREAEYRASLAAVEDGLADVEAGRTRPMDEFFQELDRRNAVQG